VDGFVNGFPRGLKSTSTWTPPTVYSSQSGAVYTVQFSITERSYAIWPFIYTIVFNFENGI